MALERSDVEKIAHLASIKLNEGDLPHITSALNSILGLVDEMQAVDTDGIEPPVSYTHLTLPTIYSV